MKPNPRTLAALSVLGFVACAASAEDITISTYYPSPYGAYQTLETNTLEGSGGTGNISIAPTGGNIGIRNSAPLSLLDIGNNTLASNAIINVNAAVNQRIGINFQSAGSLTDSWLMYKLENSPDLNFWDGSANTVTFADGGNVGIGTTTPTAKLDVTGEVKIGNTNIACTPSSVGAIRYDPVSDALQYCADNSGSPAWKASGGGGGLQSVQVFDNPGTYTWTRPSGITKIKITVIGGGARGGWLGSNNYAGGAGGACIKFLDVSAIPSADVTVGAGGSSQGEPGGTSSFTGGCSATGGNGPYPWFGGMGTGGDLNIMGGSATGIGATSPASSILGGSPGSVSITSTYGAGSGYNANAAPGLVYIEEY